MECYAGCWMMSSSPSSNESEPKRMCDVKTIGTHSGHFHCDEALACYMLKLLPEYKDARYNSYVLQLQLHICKLSQTNSQYAKWDLILANTDS